jgi:hypothetical protein
MAIKFKQKCFKCRKNYVLVGRGDRFPICYDCQKEELNQEIKDPEMKKMFDIPEDFYRKNSFLRSIKLNYIKFENLSEKQIAAFKKTVKEMKNANKD